MPQSRTTHLDRNGDPVEDERPVRDGERIVVRTMLMDGFGFPAGHRPGYVFSDQSIEAQRLKDAAFTVWTERGRLQREAWRQTPPIAAPQARQQGPLSADHGRASVTPTHDQFAPSQALSDARDQAWADRGQKLKDAWRG